MKLYEIDNAIQALIDGGVDPETGEVVLDLEALEALQMERTSKLEGVALGVKNLNAEADAIRAEEKKLAERRKSIEGRRDRLKDFLLRALDGEKLETARVRVRVQQNPPSTVVMDAGAVMDYALAKNIPFLDIGVGFIEPTVNKKVLKAYLDQSGLTEIPGAAIVSGGMSLRIV